MKKRVRLTERTLHRIIEESMDNILINGENRVQDVFNACISDEKYVHDLVRQYTQDPEIFDDPDRSAFYTFAEEIADEYDMTEDETERVVHMLEDYIKHRASKLNKRRNKLTESQLNRAIKKSVKRMLNESHTETIDLTQDFDEFTHTLSKAWNKLNHHFIHFSPDEKMNKQLKQINRLLGQIYDLASSNKTTTIQCADGDEYDEPEDWYERNEHGDFDTF